MASHLLQEDWTKAENRGVWRNEDRGGDEGLGFTGALVFHQ